LIVLLLVLVLVVGGLISDYEIEDEDEDEGKPGRLPPVCPLFEGFFKE
jgi:hypothetical protein